MSSLPNFDDDVESEDEPFNPQPATASDDEGDDEAVSKPARADSSSRKPSRQPGAVAGAGHDEEDGEGANDEDAEGAGEDLGNGEDDDDEEDEDEDEDEEVQGHRRKRHKRDRRNQFLDVEAEVEDEDEEAEDDDDEGPGNDFVADTHPDDEGLAPGEDVDEGRHRELDRKRQAELELDAEEQAARFKERYGRNRVAASDAAIIPQRLLLPSVEDPTIWGVKAKPGKEKEVVVAIWKRYNDRVNTREPLLITSCFERGSTAMTGYVYVEARRQMDVVAACENINFCYVHSKPVLVPIPEMPDLLRVQKSKSLEPGNYVRMNRPFQYKGDLAQVTEVDTNGVDLEVRLVPREDYGLSEDKNAPPGADAKRKRANAFGRGLATNRPPQRLFSEVEAKKLGSRELQQISTYNSKTFQYKGRQFINGFLHLASKISQLQVENINPTLEEVSLFTGGTEDGTENMDLAALAATLKSSNIASSYLPGDSVEIFQGEQKGVRGKAITVHGDIVTLKVTEGDLRGQIIEAPVKGLRKRFREGDHVRVVGGSKYQDELGMVIRIKDDRVSILSDATNTEVTVFSKDIRLASDTSVNLTSTTYSLHDLVQLDPSTVGCVVKVDRESLRVLNQMGEVRTMLPSQISSKLERRKFAVVTDREGSEIRNDDTVKEAVGEQRQGQVMHVHRNFLFLKDRAQVENSGIFVTRSSNVLTVAAKGARASTGVDLTKMNPAMQRGGLNGSNGGMMPPPVKQAMGRDRMLGQTVKIRKGPYKGLQGIVKETTDTSARIELHSKSKVISVPKETLMIIDAVTGQQKDMARYGGGPRRPDMPTRDDYGSSGGVSSRVPNGYAGSRTPMAGGRTPAGAGYGGMTSYGGATSYGGGATAYGGSATAYGGSGTAYGGSGTAYGGGDSWGAGNATPGHYGGGGSRTPAAFTGSRTPAHNPYDAATPGFLAAPTPGASGATDHATPRGAEPYSATYNTPAAVGAPTPGAYIGAPTPGAGGDEEDGYE